MSGTPVEHHRQERETSMLRSRAKLDEVSVWILPTFFVMFYALLFLVWRQQDVSGWFTLFSLVLIAAMLIVASIFSYWGGDIDVCADPNSTLLSPTQYVDGNRDGAV
jgi:phosphoglycerol transferase MdoB-like AlkP superfamily enzyme